MYDDVVDGAAMVVIALNGASLGVPDLYGAIFRACDHPLCFGVKGNTGDVVGVAFEDEDWLGAILRGGCWTAVGGFWTLAGVE